MKIRIRREGYGYCVDRMVGNRWKHWLPEASDIVRGEEIYDYYKTPESAEKAARKAKERLVKEMRDGIPKIIEI